MKNGEGGIRTRGRDKPYTAFPRLLDKPLRHLSKAIHNYVLFIIAIGSEFSSTIAAKKGFAIEIPRLDAVCHSRIFSEKMNRSPLTIDYDR
jgi:hypothetical protein